MNKEGPYRDQAERLRKKIDRKQESDKVGSKSALPPRSRVHQEKRKKNKWKLKYPVIRLLAMFFILLPITILSIYNYLSKERGMGAAEEAGVIETGFETVGYATNDSNKGTTIEVREDNIALESEEPGNSPAKRESTADSETQSSQKEDSEDKGSAAKPVQKEHTKPVEKSVSEKASESKQKEEPKTEEKVIYHTVKPKETIFRIAMTYYKSQAGIDIIKKANNLQSNEIQTGQVLKIPLN
ncbi:LysM peptidoglycan-binding domain-containing protein [Bacillus sp. ISL-47]|uniref:LysM peptidoglycan-binding domain-containing protein n=1 Tax=Bacillus sp. ISL-47 TaxID=2819130 RepID=UPI001BE546B9|nr:LysM peptidoglycan-binding domain-containing protein [Bacillus sp. ISL-47]MBT2686930.1 LysM peptidoglycan-binding domain-containing protein [Bacillus sp. ISL-47]MBT2707770.1 LysM peptidoglycan-binding domain-containing protein [Pseudomonas sp. ISL-84]